MVFQVAPKNLTLLLEGNYKASSDTSSLNSDESNDSPGFLEFIYWFL